MAYNKKCTIIILDVRQNADQEFKQKSVKVAAGLLKDQIVSGKKDYVSFVLVGTDRTFNDINSNVSSDGYLNIVQYPDVQVPTWQLLLNFYKFVAEEACSDNGEWLDAIVVAMEMLKTSLETVKFQNQRIILFYNFNGNPNCYDMFDVITKNLMEVEIKLIVVSNNIMYTDNADDKELPQVVFCNPMKNENILENEKYALRLISSCNAILCNFEEALNKILKMENSRPWCWNSTLYIGTKIVIPISGIIAIKNESNIKMKKRWGNQDEVVSRELKSYIKGVEAEPLSVDLNEGYMLGATPVLYDETMSEEKVQHIPGLKFVGFAKRESIPNEYFTGPSLYYIVHQKGMSASAMKLDALVKGLINVDMVVLCWKIYSAKFNDPKLVVLLPNPIHLNKPASLSMIELSYHAQHHFWDFPSLGSMKAEASTEQIEAIDNLIDSMNLMLEPKDTKLPRNTFDKDLLPFNTLPHIYEQNIIDILERKVLCNASENEAQFQEMLNDKNFVEVYWKVPEMIEQKAKNAAKKVKELFPLEKSSVPMEKVRARVLAAAAAGAPINIKLNIDKDDKYDFALAYDIIGEKTPGEDFLKLLKHRVYPLENHTLRDEKFNDCAKHLRTVISTLLFTESPVDSSKIASALNVYRSSCYEFNAFADYNKWIRELKATVEEKKLFDFWRTVIVKEGLGLCFVGYPSLEEKIQMEQFYAMDIADGDKTDSADREMDDTANDS